MSLTPELEVVVDREAVLCGQWHQMHLTVYRGAPRVADIEASAAAHAKLRERFPGRTAVLAFAERTGRLPDSETRAFISKLQKRVAPQTKCAATVVDGEGFFASAAYSVLVGVGMFMRPGCPTKFFKRLNPATEWLVEHLDDPEVDPRELARAVESLRAH